MAGIEQITIKVADTKLKFFMELMKQLGVQAYRESEDSLDGEISEHDRILVRERIKKSIDDPSRILDWETIQYKFTFN